MDGLFYEKKIEYWKKCQLLDQEIIFKKNTLFLDMFDLKGWDKVVFKVKEENSTDWKYCKEIEVEWYIFRDKDWLFKIKSKDFINTLVQKYSPWWQYTRWLTVQPQIRIEPITSFLKKIDNYGENLAKVGKQ